MNEVNIDRYRYRNLEYGEAMEIANAQTEPHKRNIFVEYAEAILLSQSYGERTFEVRESTGLGYRIDYEEMITISDSEYSLLSPEIRIYRKLAEAEKELETTTVRYTLEETKARVYAAIGVEYNG